MSLDPLLWALKDSPTADTFERLILITFAEKADSDGCNTYPSKATLAKAAMCDEKTVGRKLAQLRQRGLIAEGDQSAARHIPERYRPVVYDLQIPLSWFGHRIDRVNEERAQKGCRRSPPVPGRTSPLRLPGVGAATTAGSVPRWTTRRRAAGGLEVLGLSVPRGSRGPRGTESPERGTLSPRRGTSRPPNSPYKPPR
ncbi:helix-turn-helix domain-containing protein [Kitasatospora aburaviensis]